MTCSTLSFLSLSLTELGSLSLAEKAKFSLTVSVPITTSSLERKKEREREIGGEIILIEKFVIPNIKPSYNGPRRAHNMRY